MGLSKEEKKALKLAKNLEKAKIEEEAMKQEKRNQLVLEIAAHNLSRVEVDKVWRNIMIKAKEPIFRQNIEVMSYALDRALDKKDYLVNYTLHLRRVADIQYQRTISSFCKIVEEIVGNFLRDLEQMVKENEIKTTMLLTRGDEEKKYILENQKYAETHLNVLLYEAHELADNELWTIRGENFVKQDEDINRYVELREDLNSFLEGNYTSWWYEYKATLKAYIVGTASNQKQVRVLRKKENAITEMIAAQAKKIATIEGTVRRLRTELASYESGTKQASYRDRRDTHRDACIRLKRRAYKGVDIDHKQLCTLVKWSNSSIKYIETAKQKCEKILKVAALCRKHESLREKAMPFGLAIPYCEEQEFPDTNNTRQKQSLDSLVANAISSTCGLSKLWHRVAKAEISKRALCREKVLLEQENALMILELEGQKEKFEPSTMKCPCATKMLKRSLVQPHAVEGCLEFRKIIRY